MILPGLILKDRPGVVRRQVRLEAGGQEYGTRRATFAHVAPEAATAARVLPPAPTGSPKAERCRCPADRYR